MILGGATVVSQNVELIGFVGRPAARITCPGKMVDRVYRNHKVGLFAAVEIDFKNRRLFLLR
jgi:hypothetical protein